MTKYKRFKTLTVALVYDHMTTSYGGAELVLKTLHELFPTAPVFTSVYERQENNWTKDFEIKTSFLQNIPFLKKYHQLLVPLHPLAFESFDFSSFDIVISISNGAAKGVLTQPHQLHVCYILTPTRYLLIDTDESKKYFQSHKIFSIPGLKKLVQPLFDYLKRWDRVAAWRADKIIAISKLVETRIQTAYNRSTDSIIYPPFIKSKAIKEVIDSSFFLCLTRLSSYKRVDLAIQAALRTDKVLVIVGDGAYKNTLLSLAADHAYVRNSANTIASCMNTAYSQNKTILFLGNCTESEKKVLLNSCQALLMPGEEDFGLVGLEAASFGKPVITYYKSGIAEVLKDEIHGIHVANKTVESLIQALQKFENTTFPDQQLKETAQNHDSAHFKDQFYKTIYQFWQQHSTISAVE